MRFSLYSAFLPSGIIFQWLVPFHYKCDVSGEMCFACGLRTAVDLSLQGRFAEAYESNQLIAAAAAAALFMAADTGFYVFKLCREKLRQTNIRKNSEEQEK